MGKIHRDVYKWVGSSPMEDLPTFSWPGILPFYYEDTDGNVLCAPCANKAEDYSTDVVSAGVLEEGPDINCFDCNQRIESAYGDPCDAK